MHTKQAVVEIKFMITVDVSGKKTKSFKQGTVLYLGAHTKARPVSCTETKKVSHDLSLNYFTYVSAFCNAFVVFVDILFSYML